MKILLLNIIDSVVGGTSAFIFFQTILGKKKSKLPYYLILFIYILSFIAYTAFISVLSGNTSIFATIIRLNISMLLMFILSFLFHSNMKTRILIAICYPILASVFEYFSYYIITSIYSYSATENVMDVLVFSSISLMANLLLFLR